MLRFPTVCLAFLETRDKGLIPRAVGCLPSLYSCILDFSCLRSPLIHYLPHGLSLSSLLQYLLDNSTLKRRLDYLVQRKYSTFTSLCIAKGSPLLQLARAKTKSGKSIIPSTRQNPAVPQSKSGEFEPFRRIRLIEIESTTVPHSINKANGHI